MQKNQNKSRKQNDAISKAMTAKGRVVYSRLVRSILTDMYHEVERKRRLGIELSESRRFYWYRKIKSTLMKAYRINSEEFTDEKGNQIYTKALKSLRIDGKEVPYADLGIMDNSRKIRVDGMNWIKSDEGKTMYLVICEKDTVFKALDERLPKKVGIASTKGMLSVGSFQIVAKRIEEIRDSEESVIKLKAICIYDADPYGLQIFHAVSKWLGKNVENCETLNLNWAKSKAYLEFASSHSFEEAFYYPKGTDKKIWADYQRDNGISAESDEFRVGSELDMMDTEEMGNVLIRNLNSVGYSFRNVLNTELDEELAKSEEYVKDCNLLDDYQRLHEIWDEYIRLEDKINKKKKDMVISAEEREDMKNCIKEIVSEKESDLENDFVESLEVSLDGVEYSAKQLYLKQ